MTSLYCGAGAPSIEISTIDPRQPEGCLQNYIRKILPNFFDRDLVVQRRLLFSKPIQVTLIDYKGDRAQINSFALGILLGFSTFL